MTEQIVELVIEPYEERIIKKKGGRREDIENLISSYLTLPYEYGSVEDALNEVLLEYEQELELNKGEELDLRDIYIAAITNDSYLNLDYYNVQEDDFLSDDIEGLERLNDELFAFSELTDRYDDRTILSIIDTWNISAEDLSSYNLVIYGYNGMDTIISELSDQKIKSSEQGGRKMIKNNYELIEVLKDFDFYQYIDNAEEIENILNNSFEENIKAFKTMLEENTTIDEMEEVKRCLTI